MIDTKQHRINRIDILLYELKYEVTRGIMEGDIEEHMTYEFFIPQSKELKGGIIQCTFNTKPTFYNTALYNEPKLRVVK